MHRKARIPRHCRHKPTARGYVRLGGRILYTGRWGSPEAETRYQELVATWLAHGRSLPAPEPARTYRVEDLIADFWLHAQVYYRKDGRETGEVGNIRHALRPLREVFGGLPAAEFSPFRLKAYRERLIAAGLCRNVVNARTSIVKRMFTWAAEEEKVPGTVAAALRCVRGLCYGRSAARETEPVRPVGEAEMREVLPHLSRQVSAMVELQWLTGMRPGEVVQMRGRDLDRAGRVWLYRPATHKTAHFGKERVISMGPRAQDILQPFLRLDPGSPLFSPREAEAEHRAAAHHARRTKVPPSQGARHERAMARPLRLFGETYTTVTYGRAVARACALVGIPVWSPNQLRHAAATRIRKAFGLEAARVVLGHTSAAMTEVYAEIDQAKAVRIMEECG